MRSHIPPQQQGAKSSKKTTTKIIYTKKHLSASRPRKCLTQRKELLVLRFYNQPRFPLNLKQKESPIYHLFIYPLVLLYKFLVQLSRVSSCQWSQSREYSAYDLEMHWRAAKCCESQMPIRGYHIYCSVPHFGCVNGHQVGSTPQSRYIDIHYLRMTVYSPWLDLEQ